MTNGDCVSWAPYCSEFGFCQTSDKYGDIGTIGNIGTAETVDSVIRFSQPVLDTVTSFSMVDTFDTLDAMDSMDTSETADSMDTVDFDSLEIADVFGPFDTQDNVETSDTFDIFDTYDSVPVITLDPRGNLDTHATVPEEVTLGNKRFDSDTNNDTEAVITLDEYDLSYDTNETFEFDAVPIFNLDTNDTFDTYDTDPDDTFNKFDAVPVNSFDANDTLDSLDKVTVISSNKSNSSAFTLASVDNDAANISEEAFDIIGEDAETLNRADNRKLSELKAAEFVDSESSQVSNNISRSHHLFYFFISEKDQQ